MSSRKPSRMIPSGLLPIWPPLIRPYGYRGAHGQSIEMALAYYAFAKGAGFSKTVIAGVTEMTSASSLGNTVITLQFDLNRDIDAREETPARVRTPRSTMAGSSTALTQCCSTARSEFPANKAITARGRRSEVSIERSVFHGRHSFRKMEELTQGARPAAAFLLLYREQNARG